MRIAVYHNLPSGGGKRTVQEMVKRLADRHGLDVYTLSTAEHDFCDLRPYCQGHYVFPYQPLPAVKSPFGRLNQGIRSVDLLRLMLVQRPIAEKIDAGGYDVVFVHNCQYTQSPAVLRYLRTPTVYYCQEPPRQMYEVPPPRPYYRFSKWQRVGNSFDPLPYIYRKMLRKTDTTNVRSANSILVNSAFSRETLYRVYGILANICNLGVDTDHFRPLNLNKENFVISVGAMQAMKGFDLLISSLALIPPDQRPLLVIVSNDIEPREKDFLTGLTRQQGVAVEFRSRISNDELASLYNRALLTVCTPLMEPFGLVASESMACGTPVVGVNEGGLRESVVNFETGLLVDRDPESIAAAITQLLSDDTRRRQYGRCGREHVVQRWQWDSTIDRLEQYLEHAAAMQARNL
jgi:glycosyltransferase involved in cell wall biosynthesis